MTLTPRMTGLLAVLLVVSLAANFFIAGIFVSNLHRSGGFVPVAADPQGLAMRVKEAPEGLSQEGIHQLLEALHVSPEIMRPLDDELHAARVKARALLRQDPFDAEAFEAAQKEVAEADMKIQMAAQSQLAAVVPKLSPSDRKALAEMTANGRLDVVLRRGPPPGARSFTGDRDIRKRGDGMPPGAPDGFRPRGPANLPPGGVAPASPPPPSETH